MRSVRDEYDLLLSAPDPVEADLARELLAGKNIPCLVHGQDRDLAELGAAVHMRVARPDLYVPKGQLTRARAVLEEAWDARALSDELALGVPREKEPEARASRSAVRWFWVSGLVLVALVWTFARYLKPRIF